MFFFKRMRNKRALNVLVVTNALILIAGAMMGPIYALFVEEIGGNLLDASIAGAIFALAAGMTVLIVGRITDKIKQQRYVVIFGYLMMALGFFLYLFVNSIWFLFAIQIIIGFGEAIYSPAFDAIYSKHTTKHHEGREWALWESMMYFTTAFGAMAGGLLAYNFGFNAIFIVMAGLCIISALYLTLISKKVLK
ncbi:MFS transporter [Candidatus Uhrbacteria bacterium]|jgi:MFS family permease|nr:MFS transporter [Candidatus Uhrbacteria bacterium]MBT7717703.1 MFS transporter [Candidatus Uhrbacteria bacterium]